MPPSYKAQDLFNVNGLVAVITGGGSGLGLYAARALDANGAKAVYIVGRREKTLQIAARSGVNGTIIPVVGDVTDKASLEKVAERVRKEQRFVNLVIANAGVNGPRLRDSLPKLGAGWGGKPSIKDFQEAAWKPGMDEFTRPSHVNVSAVFYTAVAFLDLLAAANTASPRNVPQDPQVLVTSSVAGFSRFLANSFSYSVSKAGVNHLVKMLSTYFAQNNFHIRVNLIAPGLYPSEMTEDQTSVLGEFAGVAGHEGAFEGARIMAKERSPAERTGSEQDFAGAVLFLASGAGAYLNGEAMVSDGGRLATLPGTY